MFGKEFEKSKIEYLDALAKLRQVVTDADGALLAYAWLDFIECVKTTIVVQMKLGNNTLKLTISRGNPLNKLCSVAVSNDLQKELGQTFRVTGTRVSDGILIHIYWD